MNKKIGRLVIAFVMVLTMLALPLTAVAEDSSVDESTTVLDSSKLNISIGTATGKQGDMIEIPVTFETNPGIWGINLDVHYDETRLALQTVTFSDKFTSSMSCLDVDNYYIPFALNATGNSLTANVTTTGLFATMNFLVIPGCELGETTVSVTYKPNNVINVDGDNVLTSIPQKSGIVTITKGKDAEPGVTYRPQRTTSANAAKTKSQGSGSKLALILGLAGAVVVVGVVLVILVMRKPADAESKAVAPKAEEKPAESATEVPQNTEENQTNIDDQA